MLDGCFEGVQRHLKCLLLVFLGRLLGQAKPRAMQAKNSPDFGCKLESFILWKVAFHLSQGGDDLLTLIKQVPGVLLVGSEGLSERPMVPRELPFRRIRIW